MRRPLLRLLVLMGALAALVAPATAFGSRVLPGELVSRVTPGDGTLAVRNARSDTPERPVVALAIDGAVVGRVGVGRLVIAAVSDTADPPVVVDADGVPLTPIVLGSGALVYQGIGFRFKAIGGTYGFRIYGRGIDLNAVGQGKVLLDGSTTTPESDGRFSVDGSPWLSLPETRTVYTIKSSDS